MVKLAFFFALLSPALFATDYYVTQAGSGSANGTSGNPASVATFNANTMVGSPTGGDTVSFSGTITTTIVPPTSGTGNGSSRLILEFSGAVLNTSSPRINGNGKDYITYDGGGSWSGGVYTPGCTIGAVSGGLLFFTFNSLTSNDVTISGFRATANASDALAGFIHGKNCYNLVVENNDISNYTNLYYADTTNNHDINFSGNRFLQSVELVSQNDIIQIGDAYNVTIEKNYFSLRSPGDPVTRHNDVLQCFISGSGTNGNPYGWIVRYNLIESDAIGGNGNTSWTILENMKDSGGTAALKMYGNIFLGVATTGSTNGVSITLPEVGANFYIYNNTFVPYENRPGNTLKILGANGTLWARNNIGYDSIEGVGVYINWTMAEGGGASGWDYNFFYQWGTQTNAAGPNGSSVADPLFTNVGTDDYSLQSGSPCRGTGDSTIGAEFNQGLAYGATWPNPDLATRTAWDVGAYQYASGSAGGSVMSGKIQGAGKITFK